jgi:hypothetical protein
VLSLKIMLKYPNFNKLRTALHQLNLEQARQLYVELAVVIQVLEATTTHLEPGVAKGREVVKTTRMGDRLYQLERIRCGKLGCKCAAEPAELHGPYWYAYWRDDGKLKSCYVGKQLRQVE